MFRKLLSIAAATAAMTTFLAGMTTAPAQAATADAVIHVGFYDAPVTGGTYSLDGSGDLVGSLTGTVDGIDITGSSCSVQPPAVGPIVGGGDTLISNCAGSTVAASIAPVVNPDGTITGTGTIYTGTGPSALRIKCWWVRENGKIVGFDCSVRFDTAAA